MNKRFVSLKMCIDYYDKIKCDIIASEMIENDEIRDMSIDGLKKEIYAHAYVYYNFNKLPKWFKNSVLGKKIYEACDNGIDLADGGDYLFKKIFYELVWLLPKNS